MQSKPTKIWRIGTRGSALALAQAHETRRRLMDAHGLPEDAFAITVIKTSGDRIQDRALSEAGGKGLFTKEIEEAMLAREIDFSVNSTKDMPTALPDGLFISAYLPREDVRDALICVKAKSLDDLPPGAAIGTAALRRQAQLRRLRPDLQIVLLRGNLPTRIAKVTSGELDATFLALAGLRRLGLTEHVAGILPEDTFLPAVGQGAICLESRSDDPETTAFLAAINDQPTADALTLERAFLAVLDGSCRTPIAGHATVSGDRVAFTGEIILPDGSETHTISDEGFCRDAEAIGRRAGEVLKAKAGPDFLKKLG